VETIETPLSMGGASKRMAHRVLAILENRFELLMVEVQEERELILRSICLAVAIGIFGLLACIALTAVIAVAFWDDSPVMALLILSGIYATAGVLCYIFLLRLKKDWQTLPATLEQLKKDRECLGKTLA
jgi:uncharacterized membrane protein YqjE